MSANDATKRVHNAMMGALFANRAQPTVERLATKARRPDPVRFHVEPISGPSPICGRSECNAPMLWGLPVDEGRSGGYAENEYVYRRQAGSCMSGHLAERFQRLTLTEAKR